MPYPDLGAVVVYPNPYRAKEKMAQEMKFGHLPQQVTLRLYSLTGGLVRVLEKNNLQPILIWDLRNDQGSPVASGVYIYTISNSQGGEIRGRVALIR
jgi:hypothetical protein